VTRSARPLAYARRVTYFTIKAVHLIGMVSWFAGLFYLPRIFIYSLEAQGRPELERRVLREQFEVMGRRLWYGITWPAMLVTLTFGLWLATLYDEWGRPWVIVKLCLVLALVGYHLVCGGIRKGLVAGTSRWTSHRLRLWNEVATVLLIAIVLVATLKSGAFRWSVAVGVGVTMVALTAGVYAYRLVRRAPAGAVTTPPA